VGVVAEVFATRVSIPAVSTRMPSSLVSTSVAVILPRSRCSKSTTSPTRPSGMAVKSPALTRLTRVLARRWVYSKAQRMQRSTPERVLTMSWVATSSGEPFFWTPPMPL